jgi:hypothetical protein
MKKYRQYTDKDIINAVLFGDSVASVCRALGIKPVGGNYGTVYRHCARLGLDTSHFIGQAHNAGNYTGKSKSNLNKRLVSERGHRCESCGLTEWLDKPIPLEVDHVDGNNTNNDDSNLRLLCCNCHALTPTWRNRKRV